MAQLNVLVVGASIAGPMSAYWFAKAGAKITVIERFESLRTQGQAIDIRTIGVTTMRKMPGMEEAVRAKKAVVEGLSFIREDGRSFGMIKATGNPDQQSLLSEYEILRGDLSKILYDMTKDNENIKYVFNEQVVSLHQNEIVDGPVTVEFMNGYPTAQYDLVVACDGSTSRTRAIGFGCGVRDYIKPTNCWAAYMTIKEDLIAGSKIGHGLSSIPGRFMALGPNASGGNQACFMALNSSDNHDATLRFREAQKQGDVALKQFIAKHYDGHGWKTPEVLQAMMETKDFYASEIVQVKTTSLYKGRFVLVGDAGYAPGFTGGGTSLAMAGAYILAGEILKHKGSLMAGLKGYEEQMRPHITELQKVPPFVPTLMAPQSAWGLWLRNQIFAFVSWTNLMEYVQTLFGGALGENVEDKLPTYNWIA